MNEARVTRVRRLLASASVPDIATIRRKQGPIGLTRRRWLMQEARLLASRYSLQEHLDAFVYAQDHEAITGLDVDQLEQLVAHLGRLGANLDAACDPPGVPPAR
ncbi:hypothetical protein [Fulvimonas yonginensis]|uniref:Transcriptional regulator n=1 Tax=Fulvimonas yonginensis TaxID=1495200 RepID=A0ABU8JBB4_9GAMM